MAFEEVEFVGAAKAPAVPEDGVTVASRKFKSRKGEVTRYIKIQIGAYLAKQLALRGDETQLRVLFGSEKDAGLIRISVDVTDGRFAAKRDRQGRYSLTINERTADGLFSMDFPTFTVAGLEPVFRQGVPPCFDFKASDAMLTVED